VELLDRVLSRLVLDLGLPVVVVAGNHDSPERLAFGSRLMAAQRLHILAQPTLDPQVIRLGETGIVGLPHATPGTVGRLLGAGVATPEDALGALVQRARDALAKADCRQSLLVAHAHVRGARFGPSDRRFSFVAEQEVDPGLLAGFDYVALGHLHQSQLLAGGRLAYAGSLLAYDFGEAGQAKGAWSVDLQPGQPPRSTLVPLAPLRPLRVYEGSFAELAEGEPDDAYVAVDLTDAERPAGAWGALRRRFPNLLRLRHAASVPRVELAAGREVDALLAAGRDLDLVRRFFALLGEPLDSADEAVLDELLGPAIRASAAEERACG
jgi:exonuclease SbcD